MGDYHVVLGVLGSVIGALAYVPYIVDIYRGTTKPHPFTWFVFGLLNAIVFFGQVIEGGGPGSWIFGITTLACFFLAGAGMRFGKRAITLFDWLCFGGALLGVVLWVVTNEPLAAIIVVTITDALAFVPTIRKTYIEPHSETLSMYVLGTMKYILGIAALDVLNLTTVLFPASISVINVFFISMVLLRRRQLARIPQS